MTKDEALAEQPAQQEPVAWIEHEWSGTGLRHLHFEKREPAVRDEVVNPIWTPLYTSPPAQRKPLPYNKDDMDRLDINQRLGFKLGWKAAEEAHGIKGDA